jgi:hypothetical protein
MTLKMLNASAWYRLAKVLVAATFMAAIAIWILMVESFYPPKYTLAEDRATIVCTSGNQAVFRLRGLGALPGSEPEYKIERSGEMNGGDHAPEDFSGNPFRSSDVFNLLTTVDSEISKYFSEANTPGTLPPMPDHVWHSLQGICGPPVKDVLEAAPVPDKAKHDAWELYFGSILETMQTTEDVKRFQTVLGTGTNLPEKVVDDLWELWRSDRGGTYLKDLRQGHLVAMADVPTVYQNWAISQGRVGEAAYYVAEGLVKESPGSFQIVHIVPDLSTVLLSQTELAMAKKAEANSGGRNPFRVRPGFAFHEVSKPVLRLDSQVSSNYKPTTAIVYLSHDGGWPRTILAASVGILLISVAFEVIRRVFYYIIIGKVAPVE